MNTRIDLTNLGGFPLEQDTLKFMQDSYDAAFQAVANLCGNKTILSGVVVAGGNVSSGWISYNNELLPFIGGAVGAQVVIAETATQATFEDGTVRDTYFTKTATCGSVGDFPFSDLVPLLSLQNIWRPGDIKEKYCDAAYIAANFDVNGYGLNADTGWRIFSKQVPTAAGKVFVNLDTADPDFYAVGNVGGEKKHTLNINEIPSHSHSINRGDSYSGNSEEGSMRVGGGQGSSPQSSPNTVNAGGGQAHNNIQPYFVILKLIKL